MKKLTLATLFALSAVSFTAIAEGENNSAPAQSQAEVKPVPTAPAAATDVTSKVEANKPAPENVVPKVEKMPNDAIHQGVHKNAKSNHIIFMKDMPMNYHCGNFSKHHKDGHKGGFLTTKEAVKVADAAQWQDDQILFLEGNIVKQVGKNDYIFKDESGELTIQIHQSAFRGKSITPDEKVKLVAEVEKSWGKTEVEVIHFLPNRGDKWGKKTYHGKVEKRDETKPAM